MITTPAWTTPAILGSEMCCRLDANAVATWSDTLQALIETVTDRMIDYIGADVVTGNGWDIAPPPRLQRACAKQCTYEFNRRKDLGLGGLSFKDGNVSKWTIDEWLKDVRETLDRCTNKGF